VHQAALVKVPVLGYEDEPILLSVGPDGFVATSRESVLLYVSRIRVNVSEPADDPIRKILVQQQLHKGAANSLRSRSAANARQARMSSRVSSEKSVSISSSDMPPARYSRTSWTVMRIPRMHGLPLRLPSSIVMMPVYSTGKEYPMRASRQFQLARKAGRLGWQPVCGQGTAPITDDFGRDGSVEGISTTC
jgi:hypothetical protein